VGGDGGQVGFGERERGRQVGVLLVVLAEPVEVHAAQQHRAAEVVDDAGPGAVGGAEGPVDLRRGVGRRRAGDQPEQGGDDQCPQGATAHPGPWWTWTRW
jgi:hypothetical protein